MNTVTYTPLEMWVWSKISSLHTPSNLDSLWSYVWPLLFWGAVATLSLLILTELIYSVWRLIDLKHEKESATGNTELVNILDQQAVHYRQRVQQVMFGLLGVVIMFLLFPSINVDHTSLPSIPTISK
jgi:hypothetical protein